MTPYLQLLLNRKKNDPSIYGPQDDESSVPSRQDARESDVVPAGPTIPLRAIPRVDTSVLGEAPLPQQPTVPVQSPVVAPATIPLGPRPSMPDRDYQPFTPNPVATSSVDPWAARIESDRRRVIDAQNKPHSKLKAIGEGLADWAASGVGIPLRRIMHPQGSETDQANRQLATDLGLQKTQTENQDQQSTIALRGKQALKIQADLDNPDTSDEDKARLVLAQEILKSHPQPFDSSDPQDVIAMKKLSDAGIPIPKTYGKQPKVAGPHEPLIKERTMRDGSKKTMQSDDYGRTWTEVPELASEAPDKPEVITPETPDTTTNWVTLEKGFRDNAASALTAAQKAEQDSKNYIATQTAAKGASFDPAKDANVASMTAESRRQRAFAEEQTKKADDAAFKKTEAAASDTKAGAKPKKVSRGTFAPAKDGKYHYTPAQIRAQADAAKMNYDDVVNQLKARPNVIIDQ